MQTWKEGVGVVLCFLPEKIAHSQGSNHPDDLFQPWLVHTDNNNCPPVHTPMIVGHFLSMLLLASNAEGAQQFLASKEFGLFLFSKSKTKFHKKTIIWY